MEGFMAELYAQFELDLQRFDEKFPYPSYISDSSHSLQSIDGQTYLVSVSLDEYNWGFSYVGSPPSPPLGDGLVASISYTDSSGVHPSQLYYDWHPSISVTKANQTYDLQALNNALQYTTSSLPGSPIGSPNLVNYAGGSDPSDPSKSFSSFVFLTASASNYIVVPDGKVADLYIPGFYAPLESLPETYQFWGVTFNHQIYFPEYIWVDLGSTALPLFTTGADAVNFNALTSDQQAAISGAAGDRSLLYQGLGGSDTVTLPNQANYDAIVGNGQKLGWNSANTFYGGSQAGQHYTITGGDGDDHIITGEGDSSVFGSPGNDSIQTGSGTDTFNFAGSFFKRFGFGTVQQLDGGSNPLSNGIIFPPADFDTGAYQDILYLPGSANQYSFTVMPGSNWNSAHTLVAWTPAPALTASVTLDTKNIEKVRFAQPVNNNVFAAIQGSTVDEAIQLAIDSYSLSTNNPISRGWHPVSAMEVGLAPSSYGGILYSYTFLNGVYNATSATGLDHADAIVLTGELNGLRTLAIAFVGTDEFGDLLDYPSFADHYADFAPLMIALQAYAGDPINGIEQVLVSGHSLGAAMVQYALNERWAGLSQSDHVLGFTIAPPGAEVVPTGVSLTNFVHSTDFINTAQNFKKGVAGSSVIIDSPGLDPATAHFKATYLPDLEKLTQFASDRSTLFYNDPLAVAMRDNTTYSGPTVELNLGTDQADILQAPSADNYVLAGAGDDVITISSNSVTSPFDYAPDSFRLIDGGSGKNKILLVTLSDTDAATIAKELHFRPLGQGYDLLLSHGGVTTTIAHYRSIDEVDVVGSNKFKGDGTPILPTPSSPNPPPPPGTTAYMILRDGTNDDLEIYNLGSNTILGAAFLGQNVLDWQFVGLGGFYGADTSDMVLRDSNSGAFAVYDISGNNITNAASLGTVGLDWQFGGFGDFSSRPGETDMILRNSSTAALEVYDISNNSLISAYSMGAVGLDWKVAGFGDFSSRPNETDMIMRNANTGALEVYNIANNALISAYSMGAVGLDWQVGGFGNFSSQPDETDMIMRNSSTGALEVYDIANNSLISAYSMGAVGLDWQVVGFGNFSGNANETDMMMRNSNTGALEIYNIANNALAGAYSAGAVGLNWEVGGIAPDALSASSGSSDVNQLVQAMAGFDGGSGAADVLNAGVVNATTSEQPCLTTPQHG
jgi:hypothetical protein